MRVDPPAVLLQASLVYSFNSCCLCCHTLSVSSEFSDTEPVLTREQVSQHLQCMSVPATLYSVLFPEKVLLTMK